MNRSFRKANLILTLAIVIITGAIAATNMQHAYALNSNGDCETVIESDPGYECPDGYQLIISDGTWWACQTDFLNYCCEYRVNNVWCYDPVEDRSYYYKYVGLMYGTPDNGKSCRTEGNYAGQCVEGGSGGP